MVDQTAGSSEGTSNLIFQLNDQQKPKYIQDNRVGMIEQNRGVDASAQFNNYD